MSTSPGFLATQAREAFPAHLKTAHCVVCAAQLPLSFGIAQRDDPYPTCQAVACRMVASRRAEMGEAGFRHYLQMQARHTQHRAALAQEALKRKADEVAENAAAFSALRKRVKVVSEPLALLLPTGPARASRVTAQRRARYLAHLVEITAEAKNLPAAQVAAVAPRAEGTSSMPGSLCALCRGGCCTRGGEKAYLSAETMRRFMDAQPEFSSDAVVAAYLDRVTKRAQTGSCINHTAQGCSLPKEMRSDICNRFSCESLATLQAAQRAPEQVAVVIVVRRKQDHWRRAEPGMDNAVNALALLRETGAKRFALARVGLQTSM